MPGCRLEISISDLLHIFRRAVDGVKASGSCPRNTSAAESTAKSRPRVSTALNDSRPRLMVRRVPFQQERDEAHRQEIECRML